MSFPPAWNTADLLSLLPGPLRRRQRYPSPCSGRWFPRNCWGPKITCCWHWSLWTITWPSRMLSSLKSYIVKIVWSMPRRDLPHYFSAFGSKWFVLTKHLPYNYFLLQVLDSLECLTGTIGVELTSLKNMNERYLREWDEARAKVEKIRSDLEARYRADLQAACVFTIDEYKPSDTTTRKGL